MTKITPVYLTITVEDLRNRNACNLDYRIDDFAEKFGHRPGEKELISAWKWWELPTTAFVDIMWSFRAAEPRADAVRIAVTLARKAAGRVGQIGGNLSRQALIHAQKATEARSVKDLALNNVLLAVTHAADAIFYASDAACVAFVPGPGIWHQAKADLNDLVLRSPGS